MRIPFFSLLLLAFPFASCKTPFSEIEDRAYTSFTIVNETSESIPRLAIRLQDEDKNIKYDSLLIAPLAAHDSIILRYNSQYLSSDRTVGCRLYTWKSDSEPNLASLSDGFSRTLAYNIRYVIKADTILKNWVKKDL